MKDYEIDEVKDSIYAERDIIKYQLNGKDGLRGSIKPGSPSSTSIIRNRY